MQTRLSLTLELSREIALAFDAPAALFLNGELLAARDAFVANLAGGSNPNSSDIIVTNKLDKKFGAPTAISSFGSAANKFSLTIFTPPEPKASREGGEKSDASEPAKAGEKECPPYPDLKAGESLDEALEKFERHIIAAALKKCEGRKDKAAELLRVNVRTFHRRCARLGL